VSGALIELLDLVARWLHVIAGIMWIGNSLLFNWLDRNLRRPSSTVHAALGEIWLLHSGGFYFVEKTLLDGQPVPRPLHWFKWQAYTTWLSGAALLIIVYYAGGRAILADPAIAPLSHGAAVLIGVGSIVAGLALYEATQRWVAPARARVATLLWLGGLTAIAVADTRLLSGRAAFLHVGAMLGTIMAANVFLTIIPSQHELVRSVVEGGAGDPAISARAKRVSIHNNYFTFTVIVLMVSSHFPAVYSHPWSWLLLIILATGGALVRHLLNIRFSYQRWRPALAAVITATCVAIVLVLQVRTPESSTLATNALPERVTFDDARHVIDRRCGACHSAQPSDLTFGAAPAGVMFDTPEQIAARAARIRERAVVSRTMPPANKTNITDTERALLGRWIDQGAQLPR
jgi:uncharacterized membrane protein